jgi:hypothetical protein
MAQHPVTRVVGRNRGRVRRSRTASVAGIAVAGVVAALVLPGAAGASSTPRPHLATAGTPAVAVAGGHYAHLVPLCAPPKPGRITCFAIRNAPVSVKPGTRLPAGVHPQDGFGNGENGGYSPADLEALYGFSRTKGGNGQTIGIVDWFDDPKALSDLNTFDAQYGFPAETAATFKKVNENGQASPLPLASATDLGPADTSPEITLDIQSARAVCAKCKILLVEANASKTTGPTDANLAKAENTAVRLGATEVSNSFGGTEFPGVPASFVKAFNHPGVVIMASTGDDGWYSWDRANGGPAGPGVPNTPSTFKTVVSVGGTKLVDTGKLPKPVRKSETVWNENGPSDSSGISADAPQGAGGGGCSTLYKAQPWQRQVAGFAKTGCGKQRLAADVSAIADPQTGFDVFDSDDGLLFFTVGGTSLSSPVVAAMWGLAGGAHKVAYPALTLYGNEQTHPATLHDVTVGGNALCDGVNPSTCAHDFPFGPPNLAGGGFVDCSFKRNSATIVTHDHQCVAAKGFDGPSGVGTPNGLRAFKALFPSASFRIPKLHKGHKAKFGAKTRDPFPGGGIAKFRWSFGDGSHSKKAHPKHVYSKARAYTIKLTITDVFGLRHTIHKKIHVRH